MVNLERKELLFLHRIRHGLTQAKMASVLSVESKRDGGNRITRDNYCLMEKGRIAPPAFNFVMPATALELLVIRRRRSGMRQADVAVAIGVSRVTLNRMENGKINPGELVKYWE